MVPIRSTDLDSANWGLATEFEKKESVRIGLQSDTSMDREEKLIHEQPEELSPNMKFIGVVAFLAILILMGCFLLSSVF
jgi:hypothetical protein